MFHRKEMDAERKHFITAVVFSWDSRTNVHDLTRFILKPPPPEIESEVWVKWDKDKEEESVTQMPEVSLTKEERKMVQNHIYEVTGLGDILDVMKNESLYNAAPAHMYARVELKPDGRMRVDGKTTIIAEDGKAEITSKRDFAGGDMWTFQIANGSDEIFGSGHRVTLVEIAMTAAASL